MFGSPTRLGVASIDLPMKLVDLPVKSEEYIACVLKLKEDEKSEWR